MTKALTKYITTGEVLYSPSTLKVEITIDPESMQQATAAFERMRAALRGKAVPLRKAPDERNVIDQA